MYFANNFNGLLDNLLHRLGEKLQITDYQRYQAELHYTAVSKVLSADETAFWGKDIKIYPQGSLRIGTTVRPLEKQEFDLDLVCEIDKQWSGQDPIVLMKEIEKKLKNNKIYAPMVELMKRCVRLNYADNFHMDILPGYPAKPDSSTDIKVPDRKVRDWKDSNPKGYAEWFEKRSSIQILLEKKAEVEPLPDAEPYELLPPLKRAVQLIKRYRDIYFKDNPDDAPISIVLTTLVATHYSGQQSVSQALSVILNGIDEAIPEQGRLTVLNPSNPNEDLSERWNDNSDVYLKFTAFITHFCSLWNNVLQGTGIHNVTDTLKSMFGEFAVVALREQVEYFEQRRKERGIGISPGSGKIIPAASALVIPTRSNTFYGE